MSSTNHLKTLNVALGTAFASALSVGVATAAENPFGQSEVGGGYLVADNHADKAKMEGKCGEGKCGGAMSKSAQETKEKAMKEGLCGAMGKAQKEGEQAVTPETPDNAPKPE